MSHLISALLASATATLDWNLVAAAAATFFATALIAVCGWISAKKKVAAKFNDPDMSVSSVTLMDNQTIRDSTVVNREIRDQLVLNHHAMTCLCRAIEDNTSTGDAILSELRKLRGRLD